jgi:hypothetical protein
MGTALVANACLESRPPAEPTPITYEKLNARLSWADVPDEGTRTTAASAVEFATVYGLGADKPYTTLAAAEWSVPAARKADDVPAKPHRKATVVAQACSGECGPAAISTAAILPPRRPADLTVTAQASANDRRVRLLGVEVPGFVPSGATIAKIVVSWGGSIAGVIPGL